jgi:endonuclease YncB( thermonuclease family)
VRILRRQPTARTLVSLFVAAFVLAANAFAHSGGVDKDGCHIDSSTGKRHCHKKQASVCNGKVPAVGDQDVLNGRIVSVTDGDTFKAKIQGAVMEFRMADLDAPELDQPYGRDAKAMLKAALSGKDAVMLRVDTDSYGRLVAHVWIGNLHINREVVALGAAWFYPEYAHDDCLYNVENEARDAKRGLWALPLKNRVEPWVWRERKRDAAAAKHKKKPAIS